MHSRFLVVLLVACTSCELTAATAFRAGVAAVDITPPPGIPMAGYYHERGADGVLDPLFSRALVIEAGGERAAFVTLDIISVTREITDEARAGIEKTTGIPGAHVMISATHAHTGPELASRGRRSSAMGGQSQLAVDYTAALPAKIVESVRVAHEKLQPARLKVASGRCEDLAFNRRFYMRDGTVGWNPGKLNPHIVLTAGPTDPEVGILHVEPPDGVSPRQSLATYVNFAMHPDTTGGSKISADWPGALGRVLSTYHGPDHQTLVANGTCGNLNHLDFLWGGAQGGPGEQNRIATILGATVFQAQKRLQPLEPGSLRVKCRSVELDLPPVSPAQVEEARQVVASTTNDHGANFMKLVRAYRALDVAARAGEPHRVEVQAIALGNQVAWVSLPGEVFVELGLAIKRRSPFAHTYLVELANENIGYIPDRRSYAEGNYEPESARCAAGSGERLVDAAAELLSALHDEATR